MKNLKVFLIAIISVSFFLQSCQKEDINEPQEENKIFPEADTSDVPEVIINKLAEFYLNTDVLKK